MVTVVKQWYLWEGKNPARRVYKGGIMDNGKAVISRLLERIKEGDRAARKELFNLLSDEKQFGVVIQAMARKILPKSNPARRLLDTRDLVQSALGTGLRHISEFKGKTEGELLAWFQTIIRTKLNRAVRQKQPQQGKYKELDEKQEDSPPPLSQLIDQESLELLHMAIGRLPLHLRIVVELRLRDFNSRTIGEILGLSPAAVRKRESRAVQLLREETEKLNPSLLS